MYRKMVKKRDFYKKDLHIHPKSVPKHFYFPFQEILRPPTPFRLVFGFSAPPTGGSAGSFRGSL